MNVSLIPRLSILFSPCFSPDDQLTPALPRRLLQPRRIPSPPPDFQPRRPPAPSNHRGSVRPCCGELAVHTSFVLSGGVSSRYVLVPALLVVADEAFYVALRGAFSLSLSKRVGVGVGVGVVSEADALLGSRRLVLPFEFMRG